VSEVVVVMTCDSACCACAMTGVNGANNPMHKIAITILNDWLANMNREDPCFMAFSFPSRAGNYTCT
jgi:hypothetical protein